VWAYRESPGVFFLRKWPIPGPFLPKLSAQGSKCVGSHVRVTAKQGNYCFSSALEWDGSDFDALFAREELQVEEGFRSKS